MRSRTGSFALVVAVNLVACGGTQGPGLPEAVPAPTDAGTDGRRDAAPLDSSDGPGTWGAPDAMCGTAAPSDADTDGGACSVPEAGTVELVTGLNWRGGGPALQSNYLYWADGAYDDNLATVVKRMSICGGAPSIVLSRPEAPGRNFGIGTIAVDSANLYWVETDPVGTGLGVTGIVRMPLGGACPTTLALWGGAVQVSALTVDSTNVYWESGSSGVVDESIFTVPIAGGASTTVATHVYQTGAIAPTRGALYFLGIAGPNPYLGRTCHPTENQTLLRVPAGGGSPAVVATEYGAVNYAGGTGVVAHGDRLYWGTAGRERCVRGRLVLEPSTGTVLTMPVGGGAPTTMATGQDGPSDLVVDGTNVYWINIGPEGPTADYDSGAIVRVPIGGGAPTTLASHLPRPGSLLVDATSVYWRSIVTHRGLQLPGMGSLWRLTPK